MKKCTVSSQPLDNRVIQQPQNAVSSPEQSHNASQRSKNSSLVNNMPMLTTTLRSTLRKEVANMSKTAVSSAEHQSVTVGEASTSNFVNLSPPTALSYFPTLDVRPVGKESNNPSQPLPSDLPYGVKPTLTVTRPTIQQYQSADHLKYLRVLSALKSPALSAKRFFCSKCPSVMLDGLEKYEHFQVCMIR